MVFVSTGPKARLLDVGTHTVKVELDRVTKDEGTSELVLGKANSLPASNSRTSRAKQKNDKAKLVVVNHEKSKVVDSVVPLLKSEPVGSESSKKAMDGAKPKRKWKPVLGK